MPVKFPLLHTIDGQTNRQINSISDNLSKFNFRGRILIRDGKVYFRIAQ